MEDHVGKIDQINNGDTLVVLPEIKDNIKIVHSLAYYQLVVVQMVRFW